MHGEHQEALLRGLLDVLDVRLLQLHVELDEGLGDGAHRLLLELVLDGLLEAEEVLLLGAVNTQHLYQYSLLLPGHLLLGLIREQLLADIRQPDEVDVPVFLYDEDI